MAEMYCKNLPLSKDLDPQESMHGEELLSMVCNILVQVSHATFRKSSLCCMYKFVLELFYMCPLVDFRKSLPVTRFIGAITTIIA